MTVPEGAEYIGLFEGIHVVNLHGTMGQIEWIKKDQVWGFKPFDIVKPFRPSAQQNLQQPPHQLHYPGPFTHPINGFPAQPFSAMLPSTPAQQYPNGFPGFPGFPGVNGPMGVHPNISTGFVPGGNNPATGFAPASNGQVRGTPSVHVPIYDSPQSLLIQLQACSAQHDAYQRESDELEKYAALHNDEFTPAQNNEIFMKRKTLVTQLDETRKQKRHLEDLIKSGSKPTEILGPTVRQSSKSRQSDKTRCQGQGTTLSDVAQTAIQRDEKQRELHKATKKFSPDAPVFVPAATNGFSASPQKSPPEGPPATAVSKGESPVDSLAEADHCDSPHSNNPNEPTEFCTEPWEFAMVIKAAREQARRYGCEGGGSKDPEWDAEEDIRWAMMDKLPIPLITKAPDYESERPWNWATSFYNVYRHRVDNWMLPQHNQESELLPRSRAGRFSRQRSIDEGVPLLRAQSAVPQLSPVRSPGENLVLTVVDHKSNQAPHAHDGKPNDRSNSLTNALPSEAAVSNSKESSLALPVAKLRSKLSEKNLALHNGHNDSRRKGDLTNPLSRQNSLEGSFVTNISQEERGKTTQPNKLNTSELREKTAQLIEQYAKLQYDPEEMHSVLEPLAELARRVELSVKAKERSLRNDNEQTDEIVRYGYNRFESSPNRRIGSSKTSPYRRMEGQNDAIASLLDKTNNELRTVLVAPETQLMTKSMTKRQAGNFARSLIASQSPEQSEDYSNLDKAIEAPKSNAQKSLLAQLNFASGDENLPFNGSSTSMMYKARSSIASPTFEARGLVHSPSNSTEVQPPTPVKGRDLYTDHDLGLMRKATDTDKKQWANEGFRNPGNRLSHKKFFATRASEDIHEPKLTRAQRYQARHGGGNGHGTTEW